MMLIVDQNGGISAANEPFRMMFASGVDMGALSPMQLTDYVVEEDRQTVLDIVQADDTGFDAGGAPRMSAFEARMTAPGGEPRWASWRGRWKEGCLYLCGRDVTEIKAQQEALRRHEKQLMQAEAIGRMGHWRWTIGEESMEWSDEIFRIFGVKTDEFTPSFANMNAMVHRHDLDRIHQAFQRAMITGNNYEMEFRLTQPGDGERFVRCEGRCARNEQGEVIALYGIMQDMTERMLYERELKAAKEASERAYAAKTQFLANMSHELRTPLNAIIGFSEMIERQLLGPIGTEKYIEYVGGIRESGEHLLDLISDILDMSKIEAGKYALSPEPLDIAEIVKLALRMMEGKAQEAGVSVEVGDMEAGEKLALQADRRAVLQILLNLLSNAVKFTQEGGHIRVEVLRREDGITIKVRDNGIGIPANKLAGLARPFEQVSSSYTREHEGSGLGLAITKELAEMHHGSLHIESSVGVGTTVTVRLRNL
ncbi:MAG: PAS domain-containing sensor histidine kinase [Alphaproteobacteria bacterium]|nr:PAS domain-containing sensor histidine kinase [Alphaproteobacteria bacterium]